MNALSLASQRAKKVCFEYGKDVHFFIVQKWNVTGYVFGPYIGRTFFAPWGGGGDFFGTTPFPTSTPNCCGLIQLIPVVRCHSLVEVC